MRGEIVTPGAFLCQDLGSFDHFIVQGFLASPDAQEVIVVSQSLSEWVSESELADLTDVTLVSDDTFRRLGTWVTHDHLSSHCCY